MINLLAELVVIILDIISIMSRCLRTVRRLIIHNKSLKGDINGLAISCRHLCGLKGVHSGHWVRCFGSVQIRVLCPH